jgi:hypothetical protein
MSSVLIFRARHVMIAMGLLMAAFSGNASASPNYSRQRRNMQPEPRGLSLTDDAPVKIGMKPSHPGEFIREEILNELGLSVARAAEVLGVRRTTLSDLVNNGLVAGNGTAGRKGFRRQHGYPAAHAGMA